MAKFGIKEFAKRIGVKPATARVILRKKKEKKSGKSYSWNSLSEMNAAAKRVTAA
jgi:hypothetical protein